MLGNILTERVTTFLLSKGFTQSEPFSYCNYSSETLVVALDEEYAQVNLDDLKEDWASQGPAGAALFQELLEALSLAE